MFQDTKINSKKIIHICSYYKTSKLYESLFSKLYNQKNIHLIFVPLYKNKINAQEQSNSNVFYLLIYQKIHKFLYFLKIFIGYKEIKKNIACTPNMIIHAHTLFADGGIAYKIHKETGTKYIVAVRNTDINVFWRFFPFYRKFATRVLMNAEKIVFISPAYKKQILLKKELKGKNISNKCVVIPNGIDDFYFNENNSFVNKENKLRLIFVGKFNQNKNIEAIINVFNLLKTKAKVDELWLIGRKNKDTYTRKIEKMANLNSSITIFDEINDKNIISDLYKKSTIFIMPSYFETFGLTYIEAMAHGLPVIYTKGQGIDGYFKEGDIGYSVNPDNIEGIVDAIDNILLNYNTISQKCFENARAFNWENISHIYNKLYNEV